MDSLIKDDNGREYLVFPSIIGNTLQLRRQLTALTYSVLPETSPAIDAFELKYNFSFKPGPDSGLPAQHKTQNGMSRLVTVLGATGLQGGSVVRALVKAEGYTVRAITRARQSEKAQALAAQGVDVVEADANDLESLKAAFTGSYAVFAVTNFFDAFPSVHEENAIPIEVQMGTNLAKAAVATPALKHYIWSTLPNSRKISGGKIVVPHYEGKNQVDEYIKALPELLAKTTFLWIPAYAQNIMYPWYQPFTIPYADQNTMYQLQSTAADVPWKLSGDATVNVGLFVRAVLEQPEKTLPGKTVSAATDDMTAEQVIEAWAAPQAKKGKLLQVNREAYRGMWPDWARAMDLSHMYYELMRSNAFSGEPGILTKDDLKVDGLVRTAEAFRQIQQR